MYAEKLQACSLLQVFFGNLLPAFCFAIALVKIDSSLAGILNSLTPICVVLIGILVFRDKIKTQKIIGVIIGFAGLCLLTLTQKNISLQNAGYSSLVILGTISYGINVNLVSHYLKEINPLHIATISLAFMSIPAGIDTMATGFFQLDFSDSTVQWAVIKLLAARDCRQRFCHRSYFIYWFKKQVVCLHLLLPMEFHLCIILGFY